MPEQIFYILAVHAVGDVLELGDDASCAFVGFNLFGQGLARGRVTGLFEQ